MSDKSFGQHVEDGLTSLGNSLEERAKSQKKWDEESRSLGLISTVDKLRWLEAEAYRKTRVDKPIDGELTLMEYLLKTQKYKNQLTEKSNEGLGEFIRLIVRVAAGSAIFWGVSTIAIETEKICIQDNFKSDYCQIVREKTHFFTGK